MSASKSRGKRWKPRPVPRPSTTKKATTDWEVPWWRAMKENA